MTERWRRFSGERSTAEQPGDAQSQSTRREPIVTGQCPRCQRLPTSERTGDDHSPIAGISSARALAMRDLMVPTAQEQISAASA